MAGRADTQRATGAAGYARLASVRRDERGFTLMETVLVVAILAVLSGVLFASLFQTWINLQQMELDGTAKEIYMAAQNHLSLADSEGLLEQDSGISLGTREGDGAETSDDVRYFAYNPSTAGNDVNHPDTKSSALSLMLPFGSIDETVRASGSYVIRYQPSTGTVLDVFYAKDYDFTTSDEPTLVSGYVGATHAEDRRNYNNTGTIIGYYGGEGEGATALKLKAPTIAVENGDTLSVTVKSPAVNASRLSDYNTAHGTTDKLQIRLIVEGETSGAAIWFETETAAAGEASFSTVLDDVTTENGRFYLVARNCPDAQKTADKFFIPGEDLQIFAWVSSTGRAIVAKSATVSANSLFATGAAADSSTLSGASVSGAAEATALETAGIAAATATNEYTATIMSFRHLANLSGAVSHFNYKFTAGQASDVTSFDPLQSEYDAVHVLQASDLAWEEFKGSAATHDDVRVWSDGALVSDAGTFLPVATDYVIEYDGGGHRVTDVAVGVSGSAGLFGELNTSGSKVENLELLDPFIVSSSGYAGALAGVIGSGVEVSNVLARCSLADAAVYRQISGASAAGGLVGLANGGTVRECAAAVYVASNGGAAGGLVGSAANGASIADSYAGGHTVSGAYSTAVSGAGRMNVIASTNAGGLVGAQDASTIANCYSTCSAQGSSAAGGLVGSSSAGSIANCYATGLVAGGTQGAFAGSASGTALAGDWYFDFINPGMGAVAGASVSGVAAFDGSVAMYNVFATGTGAAIPYDSTLAGRYNGTYPFRSIVALRGTQASAEGTLLDVHYGDWPSPEALAKNYAS